MSTRQLRGVRTAIGRWTPSENGIRFSNLPTVSRLIRGAANLRPPPPRDKASRWDVATLIQWLVSLGPYDSITRRVLRGKKTHALLALCTSWRVASDFAKCRAAISFRGGQDDWPAEMVLTADMTKECTPDVATKVSRPIPALREDKDICPVYWAFRWTQEMEPLRPRNDGDRLFISTRSPHHNLTPDRLRNWFSECMAAAGIDPVHRPHSVRAESSTEALEGGTPIDEVLESGNWSSKTTFERHYHLSHRTPVLSRSARATSLVYTVLKRKGKAKAINTILARRSARIRSTNNQL
jgi:hypothetical protein